MIHLLYAFGRKFTFSEETSASLRFLTKKSHLCQSQKRTVNFPVADEILQMNVLAMQKGLLLLLMI